MIAVSAAAWIVIPAYDCEASLARVLAKVRSAYPGLQVVVVDDGSRDGTADVARRHAVHTVVHAANHGVGRAVKTGVQHARENGAEIFVTLGADDQRDVQDVGRLIDALAVSGCDIAIGSKFLLPGQPMPPDRRIGNVVIRWVFNRLFRTRFTDVTSGFRAFTRRIAEDLDGLADRYPFDVDLYHRIIQRGYRWTEVPVRVFYARGSSRMRSPVLVGASILWLMTRRRTAAWIPQSRRDGAASTGLSLVPCSLCAPDS